VIRTGDYSRSPGFRGNAGLLNWNIDRGLNLEGIQAAIRAAKPDLCIFQEVDLGARRTGGKDIALELAQSFGMNYSFAPEFQELSQSVRTLRRITVRRSLRFGRSFPRAFCVLRVNPVFGNPARS